MDQVLDAVFGWMQAHGYVAWWSLIALVAIAALVNLVTPPLVKRWPWLSPHLRALLDGSINLKGMVLTELQKRPLDPPPNVSPANAAPATPRRPPEPPIPPVVSTLLLCLALALGGVGCAAAIPLLVDVIAVVTDGMQVVDQIAEFARRYFASHPDADKQKRVDDGIDKARTALNVALRTSRGAKALNEQQADAALVDFRAAYKDLLRLVSELDGVRIAAAPESGRVALQAGPDTLVIPEPLALRGVGAH